MASYLHLDSSLTWLRKFSVTKHLWAPLIYLVLLSLHFQAHPPHGALCTPQTCQVCRSALANPSAQMLMPLTITWAPLSYHLSALISHPYHPINRGQQVTYDCVSWFYIPAKNFVLSDHFLFIFFLFIVWKLYENRDEVCLVHWCILRAYNRVWYMESPL